MWSLGDFFCLLWLLLGHNGLLYGLPYRNLRAPHRVLYPTPRQALSHCGSWRQGYRWVPLRILPEGCGESEVLHWPPTTWPPAHGPHSLHQVQDGILNFHVVVGCCQVQRPRDNRSQRLSLQAEGSLWPRFFYLFIQSLMIYSTLIASIGPCF